ncbi:egg cell-secreted protein 1.4-like [Malania oleifera]|uniref:egg cell-secreted protein 1.4-like n=1 Tax=Malania oleifera TaxID=397392 RepID=UPI0025ADB087|nr:egg cell-secreted protein 1.4-like [Malania oleifera]
MGLCKNLLLCLAVCCCVVAAGEAREFPPTSDFVPDLYVGTCRQSIGEVRLRCSTEIVNSFRSEGQGLSPWCCEAIDAVSPECWQAMLPVLGFSPDNDAAVEGLCKIPSVRAPVVSPAGGY